MLPLQGARKQCGYKYERISQSLTLRVPHAGTQKHTPTPRLVLCATTSQSRNQPDSDAGIDAAAEYAARSFPHTYQPRAAGRNASTS